METPLSKVEVLQKAFLSRGWTLSGAESMTGGRLASWLTSLSGASAYFKGGIVCYSEEIKTGILKVQVETIQKYGVVSEETTYEMTRCIKSLFKTDWSFAISGFAGSNSENPEPSTGKVAFALGSPSAIKTAFAHFNYHSREKIQYEATLFALDFLINELK